MKFLVILLLSTLSVKAGYRDAPADYIAGIKQAMVQAVNSAELTDSLYQELTEIKNPSALILGYMGTLEALKAKHSWNPYNKLSYVARSQKTLQKAIALEPQNIEIRFMRFSIQHFTPFFLGYSKDLSTDRQIIISQFRQKKFGKINPELVKGIAEFMISTERCTRQEVEVLKRFT